ncbi:glucoamylase family protein [Jeotgalibacillus campisalis]|nr:glucoamylase family protein [Jeotgalibacillus campisalis]
MVKTENVLQREAKGSFDFFWKEVNDNPESKGYGLIRDHSGSGGEGVASIASNGFGLSAIPIGIERGWISFEEGKERALGTLKTYWNNVEHRDGFFYHFLNMETAQKNEAFYDCPSIIDTAILLNGAIIAREYFGGEIGVLADKIYDRVNWNVYVNKETNQFYMGLGEDGKGFGAWDMYAEQLMLYFLAVGSKTYPVSPSMYHDFKRFEGTYGDVTFYPSPGGQLFTHQYSHGWFDFRDKLDPDGIDWFENSVKATLVNRQYCIDQQDQYKTYSSESWGLTACDGPSGYTLAGSPPYYPSVEVKNDGTVAPSGPAGSIVFAKKEVQESLEYFAEIDELWGPYGLQDSYNLEKEEPWYSDKVIGINKGVTLLMIENEESGLIWKLYHQNESIQRATDILKFTKKG